MKTEPKKSDQLILRSKILFKAMAVVSLRKSVGSYFLCTINQRIQSFGYAYTIIV